MNKKVIVEKIGSQTRPIVQPQQNYTLVTQGDGQNPLILACSLLKPQSSANVLLNVSPSNTLFVRSAPGVSNYTAPTNVQTCIVLTPQQPQPAVQNYQTYSQTIPPLITSSNSTPAKAPNGGQNTLLKDAETIDGVPRTPGSPSTSMNRETNAKPKRTPKSITISKKNLVALDEYTKRNVSATSSVANFLEKDTLEKGLEVLDSLDDTSLTLLVTKVMDTLNKMYGDYLEEELTAHLGPEKYRQIADGRGLTTFSEFLARRHVMVRKESPVTTAAGRTHVAGVVHVKKSKKFIRLDAKKLLMEEMSNGGGGQGNMTNGGAKTGNGFADADKCISDKINFFNNRDVSAEVKSGMSKRADQENAPINLLQVDGMNKNRSPTNNDNNNYQPNETCKDNSEVAKKNPRKSKNPRKQPKEDPFKFDPLLSRPSESIPENKSVILSSPETTNVTMESTRKLDSSFSSTSPDSNNDFPNFNFKPLETSSSSSPISRVATAPDDGSLSSRISKAFKLSDTNVMCFEESPIRNGFPGFCATSKNRPKSNITYLLTRLGESLDEKVIAVEAEAKSESDKAAATEPVQIVSDEREIKVEQEEHVETCDVADEKKIKLEEQSDLKIMKNTFENTSAQTPTIAVPPPPPPSSIKKGSSSPSSSSSSSLDDISTACDSPDLQRTVKDLTHLLRTFNDADRKSSFESGISNDSFESFAQKAKTAVTIQEDNRWELEASSIKVEADNAEAIISVEPVQTDSRLDGKLESQTPVYGDDCLLVKGRRANARRYNKKRHRRQLRNCLHKKVSSLSRTIQKRIVKITGTFRYFGAMVAVIKNGARNATIDVLRQKTGTLYRIARVVDKTFLGFRKANVVKLKSTLRKLSMASGGRGALRRGKQTKNPGKKKADVKNKDIEGVEVARRSENLNLTYSTFSKMKSESASIEGKAPVSPDTSDGSEAVTKPMLLGDIASKSILKNLLDSKSQIVQCCLYTNDKVAKGGGLNINLDEENIANRTRRVVVNQPKNSQQVVENYSEKLDAKKETEAVKGQPPDPEDAKGGRKRKRTTGKTPENKLKKSYPLRSTKDEGATSERSYPLRNRLSGNYLFTAYRHKKEEGG